MISSNTREITINYLLAYKPNMIAVFGSRARGEERPDSDLDLLVDFPRQEPITLFTLVKMQRELSEKLNMKIDLVTKGALKNKTLIDYINKDLKVIYSA
jgi:uncharacterized protein